MTINYAFSLYPVLTNIYEDQKIDKDVYKNKLKELRKYFYFLQKTLKEKNLGLLIVLEGPSAAGKGPIIEKITEDLDPRWFRVMQVLPRTEEERKKHFLYRFWKELPMRGNTLILNRSWNYRVLDLRVDKKISKKEVEQALQDIVDFEKTLTDNHYHILKLWLHVSKKEQRKRLKKMEKSPKHSWRVGKAQWKINKHYETFIKAAEEMLSFTNTIHAGWNIVPTKNKRYAHLKILETIVLDMEKTLGAEYLREQLNYIKE